MSKPKVVARFHLPEYLIEAAGLGAFMLSASVGSVLLEYPDSPVHQALIDPLARRALMGLAMGLTAIALIYSPWGRRSGAHLNPAVTLSFYALGKVSPRDALAYAVAQFVGGAAGMAVATVLLNRWLADPAVFYVVTVPGGAGVAVAFFSEVGISFALMAVVLAMSGSPGVARFTGLGAGVCLFLFITFEAPLSGMSLNPARTFASALVAGDWDAMWVYFIAPPLGMMLASILHVRAGRRNRTACAKLHHDGRHRCIFCEFHQQASLSPDCSHAYGEISARRKRSN